jgi:hypothetical protein
VAPFLVTSISPLDECNSRDQLLGFAIDYAPNLRVVSAVRLSPVPELKQVALAERILFVIGDEDETLNRPCVDEVIRIGRREPSGTTHLV